MGSVSIPIAQEVGNIRGKIKKKSEKKVISKEEIAKAAEEKRKEVEPWRLFFYELAIFACLTGLLVAGTVKLRHYMIWGVEAWMGCVLIYVISAGGILADWATKVMFYTVARLDAFRLIGRGKAHVLLGLRKSGFGFTWVVMVLIAWVAIKVHWVNKEDKPIEDLIRAVFRQDYVTRALAGILVGVILWMGKTLLIEWLAVYFIGKRSEKRIVKAIEKQNVLKEIFDLVMNSERGASSGTSTVTTAAATTTTSSTSTAITVAATPTTSSSSRSSNLGEGWWLMYDQFNIWDWTPIYVVEEIHKTMPDILGEEEKKEKEEWEKEKEKEEEEDERISEDERVGRIAERLFDKMAEKCCPSGGTRATFFYDHHANKSYRYIRKEKPENLSDQGAQLLASLEKAISPVAPLKETAKVRRFKKSDFRRWVATVWMNRWVLLHTLKGKDNVLRELNGIVSSIVLFLIFVLWLTIMGLMSTKMMALVATQILALNFFFSETAKTAFEAILFVIGTQPFDVGDLVKVQDCDQEMMVVFDINLLCTVFNVIGGDKAFSSNSAWMDQTKPKVFYPNSTLMSKHITNFYLVPDLSDTVEFDIALNTLEETIKKLETKVADYLHKEDKHWDREKCCFEVKDDDGNKTKNVIITVYHTLSNKDDESRRNDREKLVSELRKYIKDLTIELC